jgi:hypothetical protein
MGPLMAEMTGAAGEHVTRLTWTGGFSLAAIAKV